MKILKIKSCLTCHHSKCYAICDLIDKDVCEFTYDRPGFHPDCPLEDYQGLKQDNEKWINIYFSDYHKNGFYSDDKYFDTEEEAKQYVIYKKYSNCTETKKIIVKDG